MSGSLGEKQESAEDDFKSASDNIEQQLPYENDVIRKALKAYVKKNAGVLLVQANESQRKDIQKYIPKKAAPLDVLLTDDEYLNLAPKFFAYRAKQSPKWASNVVRSQSIWAENSPADKLEQAEFLELFKKEPGATMKLVHFWFKNYLDPGELLGKEKVLKDIQQYVLEKKVPVGQRIFDKETERKAYVKYMNKKIADAKDRKSLIELALGYFPEFLRFLQENATKYPEICCNNGIIPCTTLASLWILAGHPKEDVFGPKKKPASWFCQKLEKDKTYQKFVLEQLFHEQEYPIPPTDIGWKAFQQRIADNFTAFAYETPELRNKCGNSCKTADSNKQKENRATAALFMKHQEFVHHYFTPENPFGGIILQHDVGTGKTCGSAGVLSSEFAEQGYNVIWVTRRKLMDAPRQAMFRDMCSFVVRDLIKEGKYTPAELKITASKDWDKLQREIDWGKGSFSRRIMTYREFANFCGGKSKTRKAELVPDKAPYTKDMLHKTLILVDEAHNMYNQTDLPENERIPEKLLRATEEAIFNSYKTSGKDSARMVLITATPGNTVDGFLRLLNLCIRSPSSRLKDSDTENKDAFCEKIKGLVSYFSGSKDPGLFAIKLFGNVVNVPIYDDDGGDKKQKTQFKALEACMKSKGKDKQKKLKCVRQKTVIGSIPSSFVVDSKSYDPETVRREYRQYSPTIGALLDAIEKTDAEDLARTGKLYKHAIFTDVQSGGYGTKALASIMKAVGYEMGRFEKSGDGWRVRMDKPSSNEAARLKKTFLILTSTSFKGRAFFTNGRSTPVTVKQRSEIAQAVKDFYNARPDNCMGEQARFIALDSGFKEGVDLFDVKYFWLLEPPLTNPSLVQAVGRVIRRCGQSGLKFDKGWKVTVNVINAVLSADEYGTSAMPSMYLPRDSVYNQELRLLENVKEQRELTKLISWSKEGAVDYVLNEKMVAYEGAGNAIRDISEWFRIP